jgi:ribonuclease HII
MKLFKLLLLTAIIIPVASIVAGHDSDDYMKHRKHSKYGKYDKHDKYGTDKKHHTSEMSEERD